MKDDETIWARLSHRMQKNEFVCDTFKKPWLLLTCIVETKLLITCDQVVRQRILLYFDEIKFHFIIDRHEPNYWVGFGLQILHVCKIFLL